MLQMMINAINSENFKDKSILITGATGFVGRSLIRELVKSNSYVNNSLKITCVTRNPHKFYEQWPSEQSKLQVLNWDVRQPLEERQPNFDYIFHFAGENRTVKNQEHAKLIFDTSVIGTKNLLQMTKYSDVKKIIFASSGAVYKKPQGKARGFEESQETLNLEAAERDPYRAGKARAESIFEDFHKTSNTQILIARMFTFVGPFLPLDANYAIGNFFNDCIRNQPITVKSNGSSIRSYQFSTDMVNWLITILLSGKNGEIYNIGSAEQVSIKDLAEKIAKVFENKLGVRILGDRSPDPVSSFYVPSVEKAKNELGLNNYFSLDNSLLEMRRFLQKF
jgi:dTDP-glucose 4,6-dehydratase